MSETKFIVGLDIGRSAVKASYAYGPTRGHILFPSNVSPALSLADEATAKAAEKDTVTVDGQSYFVGETAIRQGGTNTLVGNSDDWIEKPEYKALVKSAIDRIHREIEAKPTPLLVIGTPSSTYAQHREKIADITKTVFDTKVKVIPQPSGAYFNHIFDDNGTPIAGKAFEPNDPSTPLSWGIIELGHYTTDFIMILNSQVIEKSFGSTDGIGSALTQLNKILTAKNYKTTPHLLTQGMITGTIKQFGKTVGIQDEVNEAVKPTISQVVAKSEELFDKEAAELDGILIAGGGAHFAYEPLKEKWEHVFMTENPRMAISQGFLKYALALYRD